MTVAQEELERSQAGIIRLPSKLFEGPIGQSYFSFGMFIRPRRQRQKRPIKVRRGIYVHRMHRLTSDRYALRRVLFLQIEKTKDTGSFIARVPYLEIFGLGKTKEQAIRDFELSLIQDYEILKEEREKLGDHLSGHLKNLERIVKEIRCL